MSQQKCSAVVAAAAIVELRLLDLNLLAQRMNLTVKAVNGLDVDRLLKETWTMESKPAKSWNGFHLNHFYFPAGVNELDWTFPSLSLQTKNQQKTKKSGTKVLYSS